MIRTNPLQHLLLTLLLLCSLIGLSAQTPSSELRILGASYNGQALLRWGPLQYELWIKGVQQGYRLERFTMGNNGTALSDAEVNASKVLLSTRLLPASLATFTAMADTNDAAGVAMAAIYNDTIEPLTNTGNDLLEALNANEQNDNRFSFALFAADASFVVAKKMALGFVDGGVSPTGVYLYRLSLYSADTTLAPVRYMHTLDMRIPLALPTILVRKVETQPNQAVWTTEKWFAALLMVKMDEKDAREYIMNVARETTKPAKNREMIHEIIDDLISTKDRHILNFIVDEFLMSDYGWSDYDHGYSDFWLAYRALLGVVNDPFIEDSLLMYPDDKTFRAALRQWFKDHRETYKIKP